MIESISRHSLISAFQFVFGTPLTFLYNALLIFTTLLIIYLFRRRIFFRIIISVFWLVLGIANGCVLANRVTPFNFTDLKLVRDLFDMNNSKYLTTAQVAAIVIALCAIAVLLVFLAVRGPKYEGKAHRIRYGIGLAALLVALPWITKGAIHANVLVDYYGNLAEGYQRYGFVYSFVASAVDTGMSEPDNYSEETEKALDSTDQQSDFVFTITVQSHGSYPSEQILEDPAIEVTGGETKEEHYQWEYYINELHEVDVFIGDLVEMLENRDEKTILVLYGDHLPTMGLTDEEMNNGSIYQTTYATWNNFGLEAEDTDLYAYQLMAYITDLLNIHEGTMFTYHQSEMGAGTTEEKSYVTDWELLQYDLLYGELYCYGGEQIYEASDLVMGVEDVVIKSAKVSGDGETLVVTGENFTPWSVVYINGEAAETEYVTEHKLRVSLSGELEDDAVVVVNQVGSKNTIFRSSNELTL